MSLEDKGIWINRVEIKSGTSDRVYIVSQHKVKRHWACSCPGYRTHRNCKHLTAMGLPCHEQAFEPAKRKGFLDGYKTYDASEGRGSVDDWKGAIAAKLGMTPEEVAAAPQAKLMAVWERIKADEKSGDKLARLTEEHVQAVLAFDGEPGSADRVETAKFKMEAYAEHLKEQREQVDADLARLKAEVHRRIEIMGGAS